MIFLILEQSSSMAID